MCFVFAFYGHVAVAACLHIDSKGYLTLHRCVYQMGGSGCNFLNCSGCFVVGFVVVEEVPFDVSCASGKSNLCIVG